MKILNFREAYEDIYGFEDKVKKTEPKPEDELPIQPFYLNKMLDSLEREKVAGYPSWRPFEDQVQWGKTSGAIRARLTPNQGVCVERLTNDLEGGRLWVTKRLVKIKTNESQNYEDSVAREIGDLIRDVSKESIDSAGRNYDQLFSLTKRISEFVKHNANKMFVYQEIKKVNDYNYNILMSLPASGVGSVVNKHRASLTAAGIIDVSYDKYLGSIKAILTTVDIQDEGSAWEIDVPYFMGSFAPSQSIDEISKAVINGLKFI
jgi:hypothetical protein